MAPHTKDSDCDVDPVTQCCRDCGVAHGGGACRTCGAVAFHRAPCAPDCEGYCECRRGATRSTSAEPMYRVTLTRADGTLARVYGCVPDVIENGAVYGARNAWGIARDYGHANCIVTVDPVVA